MVDQKFTARFYTAEQLSEHRSVTPEGFLLISDVPIARTGTQIYAHNELPALQPSMDGLILVERDESEVFRPETLASFNGKPLVDDHPPVGMLTPDSWRNYARGTVLNPRRGDGMRFDSDFMFADILVTDADTIKVIQDGKKEVSAGYDADYEQVAPGRARCLGIVGNHVALVDKGRCGPHCAIGDTAMAVKSATRTRFMDRFRLAVSRGNTRDALEAVSEVAQDPEALGQIISDEMAVSEPVESGESGKHHIEVHTHLNGMPGGGMAKDDEPVAAPAAGAAVGAGGDLGAQVAALSQRIDNIEKVLMSLSEEESTEQPGGGEGYDRGGARDENFTPPSNMGPQAEWPSTAGGDQGDGYGKGPPGLPSGDRGTADRRTTDTAANVRRAVVGDSTSMRTAFVATLSKAETLCPGIRLPTFDAAAPAKDTFDTMCSFRRKTLDAAYKNEDGRVAIETVIEGRKAQFFDKEWTCDAVSIAFNAASSLMAQKIQHRATHPRVSASGGGVAGGGFYSGAPSPQEINEASRKFYA